jgi:hypothetical protein
MTGPSLTQAHKDTAQIRINYKKCQDILAKNVHTLPPWFHPAWNIIQYAHSQVVTHELVLLSAEQKRWMNQTGWKISELCQSLDVLMEKTQWLIPEQTDWQLDPVRED